MPRGIYERKPYMRNRAGVPILSQELRESIIRDRSFMSISLVAAKYNVSRATVTHLENGNWGNGRRKQ